MKRSFLDYSMSVIVSRALPDVRDGLKPVHRRILSTCLLYTSVFSGLTFWYQQAAPLRQHDHIKPGAYADGMDRVPICLDALFIDMLDTLIWVEINHHLRMQIIVSSMSMNSASRHIGTRCV